MHAHEVLEHTEDAHERQQKGIGLTTAVVAVLLALATMRSNDSNTQKIVWETKTADWWATAHSSETNSRIYMANERLAQAEGQTDAAKEFHDLYEQQKKDSDDAIKSAQGLEYASRVESRHGLYSEIAELCLEVSIVLCSVALLTGMKLFWRLSFLSTAAGIGLIVASFLR
jgi:putative salt-induced outer membrane protein YdiY